MPQERPTKTLQLECFKWTGSLIYANEQTKWGKPLIENIKNHWLDLSQFWYDGTIFRLKDLCGRWCDLFIPTGWILQHTTHLKISPELQFYSFSMQDRPVSGIIFTKNQPASHTPKMSPLPLIGSSSLNLQLWEPNKNWIWL